MTSYYCLIAGLPEIHIDDNKLSCSVDEFKSELKENLSEKDFDLVKLFFAKYDNENLLAYLENPEAELDSRGNLSSEDFSEIIQLLKEEEYPEDSRIPQWFREFIPAKLDETPLFVGMSWEDQLTTLYRNCVLNCKNKFVRQWFEFDLNVTNILSAVNCKKHNLDLEQFIVGNNEIAQAIKTNSTKDFGIAAIFPYLDEVMRIADEKDLLEREKRLDLLNWRFLEDNSFFNYFTIEKIFAYLLQLNILERWSKLSKETGLNIFREFVASLKASFEFDEEFILNR